jgi:hypothetical protein
MNRLFCMKRNPEHTNWANPRHVDNALPSNYGILHKSGSPLSVVCRHQLWPPLTWWRVPAFLVFIEANRPANHGLLQFYHQPWAPRSRPFPVQQTGCFKNRPFSVSKLLCFTFAGLFCFCSVTGTSSFAFVRQFRIPPPVPLLACRGSATTS